MDQEANGYENIILRSLLFGLSKTEAKALIPEIESFAELGEFIKMPVKTYSAGMKVRLAFGIVTSIPAEILLLDEVVNVGDTTFIEKAKKRMTDLIHKADILVFSTHDINIMQEFCNKVLWLEHGHVKMLDDINVVIKKFKEHT